MSVHFERPAAYLCHSMMNTKARVNVRIYFTLLLVYRGALQISHRAQQSRDFYVTECLLKCIILQLCINLYANSTFSCIFLQLSLSCGFISPLKIVVMYHKCNYILMLTKNLQIIPNTSWAKLVIIL